ncbi:hypothetical protein [uncultured Roseovarius sp.]|uniref:hypothetical protein n=1 Tax=uncultured Roseovarius sp. TaxID=293344 RepID=UPI0025E99B1A|nr:hypothetical protein [uncultured Roseovarius sp.]
MQGVSHLHHNTQVFDFIDMVRVKGLEPPRQRRQNLNWANISVNQEVIRKISQDIARTHHETAKQPKSTIRQRKTAEGAATHLNGSRKVSVSNEYQTTGVIAIAGGADV